MAQRKRREKPSIWIKVSADKYEFPVLICDTAEELAKADGTNVKNVRSIVYKGIENPSRKTKYRRIYLERG